MLKWENKVVGFLEANIYYIMEGHIKSQSRKLRRIVHRGHQLAADLIPTVLQTSCGLQIEEQCMESFVEWVSMSE